MLASDGDETFASHQTAHLSLLVRLFRVYSLASKPPAILRLAWLYPSMCLQNPGKTMSHLHGVDNRECCLEHASMSYLSIVTMIVLLTYHSLSFWAEQLFSVLSCLPTKWTSLHYVVAELLIHCSSASPTSRCWCALSSHHIHLCLWLSNPFQSSCTRSSGCTAS